MSSLPPVGGTTRRSLVVLCAAPIASFPGTRLAALVRIGGRRATSDGVARNTWRALLRLVDLQSDPATCLGEPDGPIPPALRMAA
jgi:hypothetical protein